VSSVTIGSRSVDYSSSSPRLRRLPALRTSQQHDRDRVGRHGATRPRRSRRRWGGTGTALVLARWRSPPGRHAALGMGWRR